MKLKKSKTNARKIVEHYRDHFIILDISDARGWKKQKRKRFEVELNWCGNNKELCALYFYNDAAREETLTMIKRNIDENIEANRELVWDEVKRIEEERAQQKTIGL